MDRMAAKSWREQPRVLSRHLRRRSTPNLRRRRGIVGLAFTAAAGMGLIGLFQIGILRHLPEPPLPVFDADKVDGSAEAYSLLATPDAFIGLASYSLTAALAAAGGPDRPADRPWLPLAMAGKVMADAVQAARLSRDQWVRHRAFCIWCLLAAGATFAAVPLALGEARDAIRELAGSARARRKESLIP
ncbi:MAG: vitamin K epoxide reductase family protein [Desulfobacteraceae bacterium]|nr:vitamin K epoxide reductase family protein [Desulfobacteraceae bacterium]